MSSIPERVEADSARRATLTGFLPPFESGLAGLLFVVLAILVVAPLAAVVLEAGSDATGLNLTAIRTVLSSTQIIRNTLIVSIGSTLLAVAVGVPLALVIVRTNIPGGKLLERLVILPLYITPLLTAIGWSWLGSPRAGLINLAARALFGVKGSVVNLQSAGGIIFVAAMSSVPLCFLLTAGALRAMDPALEESARIQGASVFSAFKLVTLPLVSPAVIGSALLVFVHGMGLFSIPVILGLPADFYVAGTEIYTALSTFPQSLGEAAAWGLLLLLVTTLLVWLQAWLLNRHSFVTVTGKAFRPRIIQLGAVRFALAAAAWAYLAAGVFLPIMALLWASLIDFLTVDPKLMKYDLRHFYYILFQYPKTYIAAFNSFVLSLLSASAVCLLGLAIGWVLIRGRGRLRVVLDVLSMAPVAVPALTFALGILWVYVGIKWLPIYGTIWILLLAYTTHFLPFGVRGASGALRQLHPELEEAARVSGASWTKVIRWITFPLARGSLSAVWTLVFVMAMQEVSASILLYTNRSVVLSVTIFTLWDQGNIGGLAALSVLQLAFMFVVIAVSVRSQQREIV